MVNLVVSALKLAPKRLSSKDNCSVRTKCMHYLSLKDIKSTRVDKDECEHRLSVLKLGLGGHPTPRFLDLGVD